MGKAAVPRKKPHRRNSKKKRLRLRLRASLEPDSEGQREQVKGSKDDDKQAQDKAQQLQEPAQTQDKVQDQQVEQQTLEHKQQDEAQDQHQTQDRVQVPEKEKVQKKAGAEPKVHEQEEISKYECKRRANVLRNQAYMQKVGMSITKLAARAFIGNETAKEARRKELAAKRAVQASRKAEQLKQPVRKSRRLAGEKLQDVFRSKGGVYIPVWNKMHQPYGNKLHVMDASDRECKTFCKTIAGGQDTSEKHVDLGDDDEISYSLADQDVIKAVPNRITTMTFLPRADRVVIACGDNEGYIALWSPSNGANGSSEALFQPHDDSVNEIIFSSSSSIISSSSDGTVREFDLYTARSSLVFDASEHTRITSLVQSGSPQLYYVGCEDGAVQLIDRRARTVWHSVSNHPLHQRRVNSVDQHPSLDFCFATASQDETVCLWDQRKVSSEQSVPLARLQHTNFMHCAHFSPHDGSWLVTVGHDWYIDMYDTSSLVKYSASDTLLTLPNSIRVPHNTRTGTSTKLRPAWDPKRSNLFAIGCLGDSARLQIFRAGNPHPIHELRNAKSTSAANLDVVNVHHPHLDLIASGYLSGQFSLWRGKANQ